MILPRSSFSGAVRVLLLAAVWLGGTLTADRAWAFHPKSPEVLAMLQRAIGSLAQLDDQRLGAQCLSALCYVKYYKLLEQDDKWKNNAVVKTAVGRCEAANLAYANLDGPEGLSNYSLGIALMFLCEVDPVQNRPLIEKYVAELLKRQKPHGGWGYGADPTGDTSQTQYAVLGMWMAQKVAKVPIPLEVQEAATGWLMRTQSLNGGYGYQGKDPGTLTRIEQGNTTLSLSAAGCGSLYIMADLLQVTDSAETQKERPGPFKFIESAVTSDKPKKGPLTKSLEPATIRKYLATGDGFFQNNYTIDSPAWQHYYMYALERYESFKDLADGKWNEEPGWYNDGVKLLKRTQRSDGSWDGQDNYRVATCFGILFLLRSTQRAIKSVTDLGSAVQLGGYSFPPNVENIQEHDGKVVTSDVSGDVNQILELLSKGDDPNIVRMIEEAQTLKLDGDITKRTSQIETLRNLVTAGDANTRILAIRGLGRVRGLANVPKFLLALGDNNAGVVLEADRALRFVSRKTEGVGLPEEPTMDDAKAAKAAWTAWYLSVIPDAELLD